MQKQMDLVEQVDLRKLRYVDSREPSELRSELLKLGWIQSKLQHGDFMFWTNQHWHKVGITRKTTHDFLQSIGENFSKQLEQMLEVYDICVMLVELPWVWTNDKAQMVGARGLEKSTKEGILNFIHRYQAKGFILERTADLQDTITRLQELYVLYQRPYSLSARSKGYVDDRILSLPSGTRGKTGEKVLEEMKTLQTIANASVEDLINIDGIGKKKAELIYNHFHRGLDKTD